MAYLQHVSIAASAGLACSGGAEFKSYTGSASGETTLNFAHSHAQSAVFNISTIFAHSGYIQSYGCARQAQMSTGNSLANVVDSTNTDSSNGGSWSYNKITNANTGIIKNAGNYGGGTYYSVNIWGFNLL